MAFHPYRHDDRHIKAFVNKLMQFYIYKPSTTLENNMEIDMASFTGPVPPKEFIDGVRKVKHSFQYTKIIENKHYRRWLPSNLQV